MGRPIWPVACLPETAACGHDPPRPGAPCGAWVKGRESPGRSVLGPSRVRERSLSWSPHGHSRGHAVPGSGNPGSLLPRVLAAAGPAGNRARKQGAAIRASLPVSHCAGSWATTSPRAEASRNSSHAHLRLPGLDPKLPSDGLAQQGSPRPQAGRPAPQLPFISCRGSPGDCQPAALGPMSSVTCPPTHWYKTGLLRWRGAGLHPTAPHHSPPHKACAPGPVTNTIGGQGAEQLPCPQRRGQRCRPVRGLVPGHTAVRPCPSALAPIRPSPGSLSGECHRLRRGRFCLSCWTVGRVSRQTRLSRGRLPGT